MAFSGGTTGELTFTSASGRSQEIPTIGLDRVEGDVYPRLLEGRAAAGPDEVVLGSTTMADLGASVGDEVVVERSDGETIDLEVVGRAVLPAIGAGNFATAGLGRGAVVTAEVLDTTSNDDDPDPVAAANAAAGLVTYTYFLVEYGPDVDPATADGELLAALDPVMTECGRLCVQGPQQPGDIRNYDRVRSTPGRPRGRPRGPGHRHPRPHPRDHGAALAVRPRASHDPRLRPASVGGGHGLARLCGGGGVAARSASRSAPRSAASCGTPSPVTSASTPRR